MIKQPKNIEIVKDIFKDIKPAFSELRKPKKPTLRDLNVYNRKINFER